MRRCAWKTICQYLEVSVCEKLQPAGILSIATARDFLNWNSHIRKIARKQGLIVTRWFLSHAALCWTERLTARG